MHKIEESGTFHLSHQSSGRSSSPPDVQIHTAAFIKFRSLAKVHQFVSENCWGSISLRQVARIGGLEPAYFSRFFHDKVGIPFCRWVNNIRISKAIELLENTHLTITEIWMRNCNILFSWTLTY